MSFISEKDLYIFVFSPDQLSDSKSKEISANKEKFKAQLDMLINMKKYLSSIKSDKISTNIYNRIKELEEGSSILIDELLDGRDIEKFNVWNNSKFGKSNF